MVSHLSHDEFFNGLVELFKSRKDKGHGAVYLVQKRLSYPLDPATSPSGDGLLPDGQLGEPLPVIVRATNGNSSRSKSPKVKLSTIVKADALDEFFARYADICKAGMVALKPRDKSKKKAKAKKKKSGAPAAS
ncbi:signal recognition particle, SRP9/SRP14 subunit [Sodiomyces alkalinus F11]|uniref:Signal recognition particle subunit SRP14 n=1 Tax=Sodiomyces alkalinus (strain CBS 110278 / VKM F-3762 / F11) TaxID=1314773 RepID=A0A3N2Q7E2_SODAK|nr:signal recognition particle, SRP9/SRP14 subunit [Sodiomyces alkalinus F11]ROT42703.1 signal recognition particle, SRP9/SRP14 subunit [Sodiomyces alkalinus F11]